MNDTSPRRRAECPPIRELLEGSDHVEHCEACREAVQVATWLRAECDRTPVFPALDSAANLWWKAQIVRRLREQHQSGDRVERSFVAIHGVAFAALLFGSTIWLVSNFGDRVLWSAGAREIVTVTVAGFGLVTLVGAALSWFAATR